MMSLNWPQSQNYGRFDKTAVFPWVKTIFFFFFNLKLPFDFESGQLELKGNKILFSLAPILMQTILAPNFVDRFSAIYFFFLMLTEEEKKRNFVLLQKLNKERGPNLCQLFTYAGSMSTLVDPNQVILAILIDQLQ